MLLCRKPSSFRFFAGLLGCPDAAYLVHPLGQLFLPALRARMVELAAAQIIRHAFHVGHAGFDIMSILVAFAVSELLHQRRGRVSQMERHRLRAMGFDLGRYFVVSGVERIRLGRQRQVDRSLGKGKIAFRRAEKINRIAGS